MPRQTGLSDAAAETARPQGSVVGAAPAALSVALSLPALARLALAADDPLAASPLPRSPAPNVGVSQGVAAALRAFGLDGGRIALLAEMATIQTIVARLEQDVGLTLLAAAPGQRSPAPESAAFPRRPVAEPAARFPLAAIDVAALEPAPLLDATSRLDRASRPSEPAVSTDVGTQREALLARYDWLVFRWREERDDDPSPAPAPEGRPLPDCALPCLSACMLRSAIDLRCPDEHAERPGGACMLRNPDVLLAASALSADDPA